MPTPVSLTRITAWMAVPFLFAALPFSPLRWPDDAPAIRFPSKFITEHQLLLQSRRLLVEDYWAGYLIYRFYPHQRVFFDGRTDFYGEKITRSYLSVIHGHHNWRQILDENRIEAVLIKPNWAAAALLKREPGWRVVADDGKAILFERVAALPEATAELAQKGSHTP